MKLSTDMSIAYSLIATLLAVELAAAAQVSVGIDTDLSKPTYGLHGASSSAVTYDEKNGLNLRGTINDILGPPIKMANGFNNMLAGSNMAGLGASLKSGGAVLGFDAKMLEAMGGANLLKGGLLMGGAGAKTGAATIKGGPAGKKISSIIEVPVKVVAVKDLAFGKALTGLGKAKGAEALATKTKGASMIKEGDALKQQGLNQVLQGATEGMQNIGNMVQQTAGNAATAIKLLPIILDLPMGQQQTEQQQQQQQVEQTKGRQQHSDLMTHQGNSLTGGSLFGGLTSLLPGLAGSDSSTQTGHSPFNLFGSNNLGHNGYAAVLNSTSPLTNLLMNPSLNPFLLPMQIAGGPLGQSIMSKQPLNAADSANKGQQSTYNYNLFPGIKVSETMSSHLPNVMQQQQEKGQVAEQQQQQQQKNR